MATPPASDNPTVEQHYLSQAALSAALVEVLRDLTDLLNPTESAAAMLDFREVVAEVVAEFSQAAAALSLDFYAEMRAQANAPGLFRPQLVQPPPLALVTADIDWAVSAGDPDVFQKRIEASLQKAVADVGREQVVQSVAGDEGALGFARVPKADACFWCLALAMREVLYKSRHTAGQLPPGSKAINRYHDKCQCVVEPVFTADRELAPHVAAAKQLYSDATEHSAKGQSLNDFRRALAAVRRGEIPEFKKPTPATPIRPMRDPLADLFAELDASMRSA